MTSRSDKITSSRTKEIFYSDFMTNLDAHPASGMLMRVTNDESVKQSLKTIILTNYGERLYQPNRGGNVRATLFENDDGFAANDLEDSIRLTVRNNSNRVQELDVKVTPDSSRNGYRVQVAFTTVSSTQVNQFELVLTRTR